MVTKAKARKKEVKPPLLHNGMIKFVKLKTGEDLVSFATPYDDLGGIVLSQPLRLGYASLGGGKTTAALYPWLPIELITNNGCFIREIDILTMIEPSEPFIQFYLKSLIIYNKEVEDNAAGTEDVPETKKEIPSGNNKVTIH